MVARGHASIPQLSDLRPDRVMRGQAARGMVSSGMSIETITLGLVSGLRPATSQAAVIALLKTSDPRRALLFFLVAGFLWSMAVGLVLVLALHGARVTLGGSTFTALFDLVAGVAALAFAIGYRQGRVSMPRRERRVRSANGAGARLAQKLRDPSVLAAAVAGVATHIPGLIYVVALNAIAAEDPSPANATVQVGIYNVLWFAVPIAALALAILRPGRAPEYLEHATRWGRRHEQVLVVVTLTALGVYLTVKAVVQLN
jgi:Sap, sulfolipid-1-addressing protein